MAIRTEDIKIKASQLLTEDADAGGYMTATEIVDGAVNNLFPDISRLDRTYGRVSLRKFYLHVDTATTDTYYGSHVIITEQAKDPNISVALFTTGSDSDRRADAVDRLESYVTLGPRFAGWMWGDQPQGARQLLLFAPISVPAPEVNDVLCLFNDRGQSNEFKQFVRVTGVSVDVQSFSVGSRKIITLDIGDPLARTFVGMEIHNNDSTATNVYTTTVSDAASYYGVMTPTEALSQGDTNVSVADIYTQLVPTSQAEDALTDQTIADNGPITASGPALTTNISGFSGTELHLPGSIVPGTLSIVRGGQTYTDQGDGVLLLGSNSAGTIDYANATISFASQISGNLTITRTPGAAMSLMPKTILYPVPTTGHGYSYVGILWPLPHPETVVVDYLVDGNWYRLRDNGKGELVPDIPGTGTGRINYSTGHLALTCAAIPDAETAILMSWGNPVEIVPMAGRVAIEIDPVHLTLPESPVAPGSVSISWPTGASSTATATDDGNGNITGDATGWVVYGSGELHFTPTSIPVANSTYDIGYEQYPNQTETASGASFTLASGPKPGTLQLDVACSIAGRNHTYRMRDDAQGNMTADGFEEILSQCRASLNDSQSYASQKSTSSTSGTSGSGSSGSGGNETFRLGDEETTTTLVAGGISATVDYVTGQVVIDLSTATSTTYTIATKAVKAGQEENHSETWRR